MAETPKPKSNPSAERDPQPFLPDTAAAPQTAVGANRKVLIVDDNPVVIKAFQVKLQSNGFTVFSAADATEGIAAARRERPDAIVLDLNFPQGESFTSLNWGGISILQWLKRYQEVANIPIIILTVENPGKHKDQALAAGAAAFFQKPVDLKVFLAELLRLIGDKPRSA